MGTLSAAGLNAACDAIVGLLDSSSGAVIASPRFFLTSGGGVTQVRVFQLATASPTWGAASGGVASYLHAGLIPSAVVANNGTIARYTLMSRSGDVTLSTADGGVGDVGSGAEIEMDRRTVTSTGQRIRVDALDIVVTN